MDAIIHCHAMHCVAVVDVPGRRLLKAAVSLHGLFPKTCLTAGEAVTQYIISSTSCTVLLDVVIAKGMNSKLKETL